MTDQENQGAFKPMGESDNCKFVGTMIMCLGIFAGAIFIFMLYGQYRGFSVGIVAVGAGITLNSIILGYLFHKIGSVLKHLENKK